LALPTEHKQLLVLSVLLAGAKTRGSSRRVNARPPRAGQGSPSHADNAGTCCRLLRHGRAARHFAVCVAPCQRPGSDVRCQDELPAALSAWETVRSPAL